jgi:colanic acid/amylovoran biosynthesis protein
MLHSGSNHTNVVLLGATFDTGNRGVSALAAGAIQCMRQRFPDATVSLMDYAKTPSVHVLKLESGAQLPVPLVNMRFSKKFYLPNNIAWLLTVAICLKLVPFTSWRNAIIRKNACLRSIDEAVCVGSIAGGDSFSDIYGLGRLLYVALPQILVILLGRELLLMPQTIGPFKGKFARWIARYILSHAERVYSRDYDGHKKLEALLGQARAAHNYAFCHDVGFLLSPTKPAHVAIEGLSSTTESDHVLVGLNVSGLLLIGGYTRNNMFGLRSNYKDLVYKIIEYLIRTKNASVVLVPHVFGAPDDPESDLTASERIYSDLKNIYPARLGVVRENYNESEIKYVIGQCDFFIGSRMHACIAALSQCIPTLAIAYSAKFAGVLNPIGIDSIVADARMLEMEQILQVVDRAYTDRAITGRRLTERVPGVKASILNFFTKPTPAPEFV